MSIIRNKPRTHVLDDNLGFEIAKGSLHNYKAINKFGYNPEVNSSEETLWYNGGTYIYPTTATIVSLSSNDNNDTQNIVIIGLDANYNELEEEVTLNGTTTITTTKTFFRVFRMYVNSGSNLNGTITAYINGSIVASIEVDYNQTLMGLYTIPNGYTGYLNYLNASTGKQKEAIVMLKARNLNGVFNIKHLFQIYANQYIYEPTCPLKFEAKTDIEVSAMRSSGSGSLEISTAFDLILIKDI